VQPQVWHCRRTVAKPNVLAVDVEALRIDLAHDCASALLSNSNSNHTFVCLFVKGSGTPPPFSLRHNQRAALTKEHPHVVHSPLVAERRRHQRRLHSPCKHHRASHHRDQTLRRRCGTQTSIADVRLAAPRAAVGRGVGANGCLIEAPWLVNGGHGASFKQIKCGWYRRGGLPDMSG
jgi:hypothetical protein